MKQTYCIDANVVLRFLLNDHPLLSLKAKHFIERAQHGEVLLYMDEVVVAEVVWVLSSFYEIKREAIGEQLLAFLVQPWVINPRKKLLLQAIQVYQQSSVDYIDAWLITVARAAGLAIETFDAGLTRLAKKQTSGSNKN